MHVGRSRELGEDSISNVIQGKVKKIFGNVVLGCKQKTWYKKSSIPFVK